MKINESESQLELTRANVRFYEKEGLLQPARKENGYREYSDEDVATLYPLVLSGIIFLITFPIFVIHRKYKNAKPEEETPTRHPVLKSIFKWIGGFAYFVAYLFLTPLIGEILFTYVNGNVVHTATFDFFFLYWIMGLFVLFMFVYLYSKHGLFPDYEAAKDGIKARLPQKAKRNVALVSVAALCLSFFLSMLWYDCFTVDGLTVRRLFFSKSYTWDEIPFSVKKLSNSPKLRPTKIVSIDRNPIIFEST